MAATSSIAIAGTIDATTTRKATETTVSQVVDEIEVKQGMEVRVPVGGGLVSVPLPFSTGIAEALILHLYSPKKLVLRITGSDVSHAGPIDLGIKGHWFITLTPGEGIAAISASNPSTTDDVTLEYSYGAKSAAGDDDPTYWDD
jgi:hypothetical protein